MAETPDADPSSSPAHPRRRRVPGSTASSAVFAVAGLLFVTSATTAAGGQLRDDVVDLPGLVLGEQGRVADGTTEVARLRAQVDALGAGVGDPAARALQSEVDQLAPVAGLEERTGPGLEVTLDDAPMSLAVTEGLSPDDLIVHQQDLQAVVNALWAGGAQGIALMDQQIISTSAVRCVGNTLRLQGRVYAPPYTVTALGDPDALQAALDASAGVQAYRSYQVKGLVWDLQRGDALRVPGYAGSLKMQHARASTASTA